MGPLRSFYFMTIVGLTVLAVAIGYAGQASQVAPVKKKAAKTTQNTQKPKPGQGGAVVFVDPATHQIREATPADIGTLSAASPGTRNSLGATRSAETPIQGAGGAIGVVLGPEFDSYLVVTKTPDGKLKMEEVTGHEAAHERVVPSKTRQSRHGK